MILVLEKNISKDQIEKIIHQVEKFGFEISSIPGKDVVLVANGLNTNFDIKRIKMLQGVKKVISLDESFMFANRSSKKENTIVKVRDVEIGGNEVIIFAGPCSIESEEQIFKIAATVKQNGAKILRGGAFKPRTSPYSFQGLGEEGLKLLRSAGDEFNLPIVTEVLEVNQIDLVGKYTDIFQVGSRNMQNFPLLKELGKSKIPVMLKRGMSASIDEWLMSAEHILSNGNSNVILCERGIRTFETSTRFTIDLAAIPVIHQKSHLPIIADPSHATGISDKVIPMARAAVAADADGLMVEVHHDPINALSDGPQALVPEQFSELISQIKLIAEAVGRRVGERTKAEII